MFSKKFRLTSLLSALTFIALCLTVLMPSSAFAACSTPAGNAGDIIYNSDYTVMQWCDDTDWRTFNKSGATPPANADPCDPANTPSPGQACTDGTVYTGLSPDGSVAMYTTRCDAGMAWNGASCTGTRSLFSWNDGTATPVLIGGLTNNDDGDGNTNILANLANHAEYPFQAASYCYDLAASSHSDWYLPSRNELTVFNTNRVAIGNFLSSVTWPSGGYYWSSREASSSNAALQTMSGAAPDVGPKYAEIKVRCARKGYIRPCLNPVGQPGDMMYNHDDNVLQWCGGGLWHQAGPIGIHAPVSTTNIVGHWRLNSTSGTSAIDSSGNNHTGTLTNMDGNTDWVTGEVEGALDLDGSDDHVILGDLSINTNTLTITAWINLRSKDGYDGIVFSRPPATGMNIDSSGSRNLGYHWNDNSNTYSWDSGLTIPLNEWVMAAIVVEPTQATAYLYQNGTLSSAVNNVAHPTINPVNWLIGKDDIFTRWIDGMIDDVRIYTRALNATEIEALAQHCVDPAGKPGDIIYNSDYQVPQYCNGAEWVAVGKQATLATSCKAILDAGDSTGNGVYAIAPDGVTPISAYCDMTTDGGGWTMVAAQFENDPVPNWNEGIQGDYDPDLSTNKGFALNTAQLPAHTEIGFGKDLDPTFVDYVTGIYTTGNIATATVVGASGTYQIHRNASGHFGFHDPDTGAPGSDPQWDNTLTIDALGGGPNFNWAFSPQNGTNNNRGYAMASDLQTTGQSYAWSVWVR